MGKVIGVAVAIIAVIVLIKIGIIPGLIGLVVGGGLLIGG